MYLTGSQSALSLSLSLCLNPIRSIQCRGMPFSAHFKDLCHILDLIYEKGFLTDLLLGL